MNLFTGMALDPQGHRDPNCDSPAKVLMNCRGFSGAAGGADLTFATHLAANS
jgi:hypothetical protein